LKFLHLSDLHLGKTVHEFSMLEDQEYILKAILAVADEAKPQAVLIAGDIYDRMVAPTEALRLLDDFLEGLVRRGIEVFIISGNHDSAGRLAFGARLMDKSGVHISPVYDGQIKPYTLRDEYGDVNLYLMPFLKPLQVKRFFPEAEITTWTDAVKTVLEHLPLNESGRNVLLAHQFVTGATTCESEEIHVGGADNVDGEAFAAFDYVALGHLHKAQHIGRKTLRYCGTPLKYSFSEANHQKSVTLVTLAEKGAIDLRPVPLVPKRDMREIRGTYLEVTARDFYRKLNTDDYFRVTLTDEDDQPEALGKLRVIYPNLMRLDYDNTRTRTKNTVEAIAEAGRYTPMELFDRLYGEQNGLALTAVQRDFLSVLIEQIWEGEA
jgi:exonuclease SbcD